MSKHVWITEHKGDRFEVSKDESGVQISKNGGPFGFGSSTVIIDELLNLAAQVRAYREALESISFEKQNFTDRFTRNGLDDAHVLFDIADKALYQEEPLGTGKKVEDA